MDIYNFKSEDAFRFASEAHARTKITGKELTFTVCPYCGGGANNDKANQNTFSINLETGQFACFRSSCGIRGNMLTLHKDFSWFTLGKEVDEYFKPRKQYKRLKTPSEPIIPKPKAIEYLKSRGISEDTAARFQITVRTDNENILVMPMFDEKGEMQSVKYRNTAYKKGDGGSKEFFEKNTKPILYGMWLCDLTNKSLIVTEGQIDCLSVSEAYMGQINAVSVPNGCKSYTFIPYCWDWLSKFEEIIVFGDCENGGITLLKEFSQRFGKKVKSVRVDDYKDCKDANEILQKYGAEQIKACIENAESQPIKKVIDMSEVKDIDIFDIPKLKTGIFELDYLLYGGLPFGYMHIIAGKRGDGKSTFANQIICHALDQNYNCFIYSGELTSSNLKAWINYQLAGQRNIVSTADRNGNPRWNVPKDKLSKISEWYRGRLFVYDNSAVDDEEDDLVNTIEEVILKYGVKVILIDNLMTALDLDLEKGEKFEKQSKLSKKLTKLALRHNVMVLLVAHRRKNGFTTDANDEISGSADITNLAGIVVSYDRSKDEGASEFDRKLIVAKNRLFGRLNFNGYTLSFEEKSKRIYGSRDNVGYAFGWERDESGFYENDETPFE